MSAVLKPQLDFAPMRESDLDWIAAAERTLYEFPWTRGNFADSLAAGYSAWVAALDRRPIGYAVMMLAADEAHLLNLSVLEPMHGRGYGRRLLEYLESVAASAGARQIFLEVRPSNPIAQNLYRSDGFAKVGRRRAYYPARGGREDAIVMVKLL